jgi:hypothetical protein
VSELVRTTQRLDANADDRQHARASPRGFRRDSTCRPSSHGFGAPLLAGHRQRSSHQCVSKHAHGEEPTLSAPISPFQFCRKRGFFGDLHEICSSCLAKKASPAARQIDEQSCVRYSSRPSARLCPQSRRYVPGSVFDGMARDGQPVRTVKVERCRQLRCPVSTFGSLGCFW